jgi:hypothetical protein
MDYVEGELCRRLFWIIFSGDKSAGILGKRAITLGRDCFDGDITARYTHALDSQDHISSFPSTLYDPIWTVMTGFNFCQDLWRSADMVLAKINLLRDNATNQSLPEGHINSSLSAQEYERLTELHLAFETSLDDLPEALYLYPTPYLSPASFHFGQETNVIPLHQVLGIQRVNLHLTFLCLRLVIAQAMAAFMDSSSQLWASSPMAAKYVFSINNQSPNADPCDQPVQSEESPDTFRNIVRRCKNGGESPHLLLQKIRIAKDMIYLIQTSTLENLRVNGESCVEKIRLVGVSMLALIDHYPSSPLAKPARQLRDLFPHILAHLDSKASESLLGVG